MKSFAYAVFLFCVILVGCLEVHGASVTTSRVPKNFLEEIDGIVTISVYIDKRAEPKIKELEGTAMLRTNRLLRRQFKELPKNYSVPISVERADYDANEEIYTYVTKVHRRDIETYIDHYKEQERQRIAAEKAAAEKAEAERAAAEKAEAEKAAAAEKLAAEKAAAEKAEAERAATEKVEAEKKMAVEQEEAEKLAVTRAASQKVAEARRNLDAKERSQNDGKWHVRVEQTVSPRENEMCVLNGNDRLIEESKNKSLGELRPETVEEAKKRNANESKMADDAVMNLFQ